MADQRCTTCNYPSMTWLDGELTVRWWCPRCGTLTSSVLGKLTDYAPEFIEIAAEMIVGMTKVSGDKS